MLPLGGGVDLLFVRHLGKVECVVGRSPQGTKKITTQDYYNYSSGFKAMFPHNAKCLTWIILLKHIKQPL